MTKESEMFYRLERPMAIMGAAILDTPERIAMHKEAIALLATIFGHLNATGEVLEFHLQSFLKLANALRGKMR